MPLSRFLRALCCLLLLPRPSVMAQSSDLSQTLAPFFQQHCVDCHGEDEQMGGVALHMVGTQDQILAERDLWVRVVKMVQLGAMPPEEIEERPSTADSETVVAALQDALLQFDCSKVARPGHPTIRRLNRAEYNNTVRDLFGVSVTPADDFPSDDVGDGFDNIGGVLSVSPLLLEKYLAAAEQVTAEVLDTTDYSIPQEKATDANRLKSTTDAYEDRQGLRFLKQAGQLSLKQTVPATGKYDVIFAAAAMPPRDEELEFELRVDGETERVFALRHRQQPKRFKRRIELSAGQHQLAFEFYGPDEDAEEAKQARLGIGRVALRGPMGKSQPDYPEKHLNVVLARPTKQLSPTAAAQKVVAPLLRRVFRRPVTEDEINRFAQLTVRLTKADGMTWERAVAGTIQAMLVSPDFLFRVERNPAPGETVRMLDEFELASRLSYFLWSTMPDEELFRVAESGQLSEPSVLVAQLRRMIADDRSVALVDNFAAQWLNLRLLEESRPDRGVFDSFSGGLRDDMLKETSAVIRHIMQEDLPVDTLLSGDFTFVNERLARHYGLSGVSGDQFVRVSLADSPRRGVLMHASVLTLTSYPRRTSPVQRGKWILENLFGDAPPAPPPDVPELEDAAENTAELSVREQMAAHRTNPVCASCHQVMDPLGLGLENFDGIGRWRTEEHGRPVDASGELPGGIMFSGPQELVEILLSRRDDFLRTLTEKMLVYATGRGLKYYDRCTVDQCLEHLKQNENRFSALVESIVLSDAFLRRGLPE